MSSLYILQLQGGKYYVGKTNDLTRRYHEHKTGQGSEWTSLYKPIKMLETRQIESSDDENNITKQLMKKYGIENVRGGSYVQINLPDYVYKTLQLEIRGNTDACFKCGEQGHFARNCLFESESESEEEQVWVTNCCKKEFKNLTRAVTHERKCMESISPNCYRCGRKGHYSTQCYARSTVDGDDIDSDSSHYNSE